MSSRPPKPQFSTKRGNGQSVLAGVDGRSTAARRFREIRANVADDLGGDLSEAQMLILDRAASIAVWCEEAEASLARGDEFDISSYSGASNTLRRLLSELGLKRVARDVTDLTTYLKGQPE